MRFVLRILPVTAAVATLGLAVRVGELAQPYAIANAPPESAMALSAAIAAEPAAGAPPLGSAVEGFDSAPAAYSPEELAILQDLSSRRQLLEERERALGVREGLLEAAEQRIDAKIEELETLRAGIQDLVRLYDEQEESEIQSLVKIYETMKPKDAARILNEIEMEVRLSIMERMKERSSAPVLAEMDAEEARAVTRELARRREMAFPRN